MKAITLLLAQALVALAQDAASLVGTWELEDFSVLNGSKVVQQPFGAAPVGKLVYTAGGTMAGQIMADSRTTSAPVTAADFKAAFLTYISYFGTFSVDPAAGSVTHHVSGSLYPNWVGTTQVRGYNITTDGKLALSTNESLPAGLLSVLRWKRILSV